jgi:hypothetical protein
MEERLLQFLYTNRNDVDYSGMVSINKFLSTLEVSDNFKLMASFLDRLQGENSINYSHSGPSFAQELKEERSLKNVTFRAKITGHGENKLQQLIRERRQDELNENIKTTNVSLQKANLSSVILNSKTDGYYKQLKRATWVIAFATVITMLATIVNIGVTIYVSTTQQNNQSQPQLQLIQPTDTSSKEKIEIPQRDSN